jgi:hypothetical protein
MLLGHPAARADNKNDAALLKALDSTHVTLEEGLKASEIAGEPISARFEIENGDPRLSVYTTSNDCYREVRISAGWSDFRRRTSPGRRDPEPPAGSRLLQCSEPPA